MRNNKTFKKIFTFHLAKLMLYNVCMFNALDYTSNQPLDYIPN